MIAFSRHITYIRCYFLISKLFSRNFISLISLPENARIFFSSVFNVRTSQFYSFYATFSKPSNLQDKKQISDCNPQAFLYMQKNSLFFPSKNSQTCTFKCLSFSVLVFFAPTKLHLKVFGIQKFDRYLNSAAGRFSDSLIVSFSECYFLGSIKMKSIAL